MSRRKQPPPKPRPQTQSDQKKELDRQLSTYSCTLDKDLSERARLLGLERNQNVCTLVNEAVDKFIKEKRESQK